MNDYCKISARANLAPKSRSVDFSDLSLSPPHTPKYPKTTYKPAADAHGPVPPPEEEGAPGERFGVILSRNCSSASQRFRARESGHAPTASGTLQAALRRAFSMRKSSSLTEGYRRIHDTAEDGGDGDCDAEVMPQRRRQQQQQQQEVTAPRKKRGRIIGAWKRIFGF